MSKRSVMDSNREWEYWGKKDPLWSVAGWEGKAIGQSQPWKAGEFLELGKSDYQDVRRYWSTYGMGSARCVEIGCGAGRMTSQLLGDFGDVVALDISSAQIEKAKELLGPRATNVRFLQVDIPSIPIDDESCDGMFSTHVFQHLSDFAGIEAYLRESLRVLRTGGTVCFHLPVPGAHLGVKRTRLQDFKLRTLVHVRRLLRDYRATEYRRYAVPTIFETLTSIGFAMPELHIFPMSSNGDLHSFFFARKP